MDRFTKFQCTGRELFSIFRFLDELWISRFSNVLMVSEGSSCVLDLRDEVGRRVVSDGMSSMDGMPKISITLVANLTSGYPTAHQVQPVSDATASVLQMFDARSIQCTF